MLGINWTRNKDMLRVSIPYVARRNGKLNTQRNTWGMSRPKSHTPVSLDDDFFDFFLDEDSKLDSSRETHSSGACPTSKLQTSLELSDNPKHSSNNDQNKDTDVTTDSHLELRVNPKKLRLLPFEDWIGYDSVTFGEMIERHFRARSTKHLHFEHKLWNALVLTKVYPNLTSVIGVSWAGFGVIKVDKSAFGALLGLTKPTAALFNPQGSFRSHGFHEITSSDWGPNSDTNDRLFVHRSGRFNESLRPEAITQICRWSPT